jgi:hypothetical protein
MRDYGAIGYKAVTRAPNKTLADLAVMTGIICHDVRGCGLSRCLSGS